MNYEIKPINKKAFFDGLLNNATPGQDGFAKTFLAKADARDLWPLATGAVGSEEGVMAASVLRLSKRAPTVANLELIHTFARFRGNGLGRALVEASFHNAGKAGAQYFRVSSEPWAVGFYRGMGFKFWGAQKSGPLLSMFRIEGDDIASGAYDAEDSVIRAALAPGRRGGVTKPYDVPA